MSALKSALTLVLRNTASVGPSVPRSASGLLQHGKGSLLLPMSAIQARFLNTQDVTKNIQYITSDKSFKLEKDPDTFKLAKPVDKPLCVMFNWLLAKQKHVKKYATLYTDQGFDVLSISCTPWQLLWPMKGSQLVAVDALKFLGANMSPNPIVLHGFSVGGYMFGEICLLIAQNKNKYQPVLDRVAAQVWDSAADISEIPIGVPKAVFPKNQVMQNTLRKYILYHMKTFHESATIHYMRSSQQFHRNLCRAPALFLLSKTDPVGAEDSNRRVHDSWKSMGIETTWHCWDKSPHVMHFSHHKSEYLRLLGDHLDAQGLLSQPDKIRAKV